MKLRKNDPVIVIAGNDKGREGTVKAIDGDRIVVSGVNMKHKHQKSQGEKKSGAIVKIERSIHISNVAYCVNGKAVKLRVRSNGEKKELFHKMGNNEETLVRTL